MKISTATKAAIIISFGFVLMLHTVCIGPEEKQADEIFHLPGLYASISFKQYSGYLNASDGQFLFYWFVESQSKPSEDPVLLWLNGGPGCSSVDGFFSETGPYRVKGDGETLSLNLYSWNKFANVLFLETPTGVGFSYSTSKNYSALDDDKTATSNYFALHHFFRKFPEFKNNEFYISGESYAGVFIPTLSVKLLFGQPGINFKGFAIGNGALDENLLSRSVIFFSYFHGLVGIQTWDLLTKKCCKGYASRSNCQFTGNVSQSCKKIVDMVAAKIYLSGLNNYNIYKKCINASRNNSRYGLDRWNILQLAPSRRMELPEYEAEEYETEEYTMEYSESQLLGVGDAPCTDDENITEYLSQEMVRIALHVHESVPSWEPCNHILFSAYKKQYISMKSMVLKLINSGKIRGLIYNGDVDSVCNFLGNEWFVSSLNLPVMKDHDVWFFDGQVAGFVKYYENLTYLTVKGSGHMVPQDKEGPAFQMMKNFLRNVPY